MEITLADTSFILLPEHAMYWSSESALLIADAHFSKEQHFRKNGIAIPGGILDSDLKRLDHIVSKYAAQEIIFLGDMFHSDVNEGMHAFMAWRKKNSNIRCTLIIGNHDVLDMDW